MVVALVVAFGVVVGVSVVVALVVAFGVVVGVSVVVALVVAFGVVVGVSVVVATVVVDGFLVGLPETREQRERRVTHFILNFANKTNLVKAGALYIGVTSRRIRQQTTAFEKKSYLL